jgi:hypothetical protein
VPLADVIAGVTKTYTHALTGSGHTHTVMVSAAQFTALRNGQSAIATMANVTTDSFHNHTVTLSCE